MRWTIVVLALAVVACGDDPVQIEVPSIDGGWVGELLVERPEPDHPYAVRVQVNLIEVGDGVLAGCAAFSIYQGAWELESVAGTIVGPSVELSAPWDDWSFTGSWADGEIAGQSTISGRAPTATTFSREPDPIC